MIAPTGRRLHVSWFTSATDGREHAVTDEEYAQARAAGTDPEAMCGEIMMPTPLMAEIGRRCGSCARYIKARKSLPDFDLCFRDRPFWLARLKTSWPFRGGPRHTRSSRNGKEPNRDGPAVPPTGGTVVLHP